MGYRAIAFVVLIPVMSYSVVKEGLPQTTLLFVIPCYILLAWSFYMVFKNASKPKLPTTEGSGWRSRRG
jgi:hypothetical protein